MKFRSASTSRSTASRASPASPTARPELLASVADLAEVELVLPLADLIDLKDPTRGALGAWPLARIGEAVRLVGGRRPVSATVGDLPPKVQPLACAAIATAAQGVDLVKVGFFAGGDHHDLAQGLAPVAARDVALVAVLMADQRPDLGLVAILADAGFRGVMLDTADKASGGLRHHLDLATIMGFVACARRRGLLSGLAGSLAIDDIAPLASLQPDFLGFRGALCREGRTAALDRSRLVAVRSALSSYSAIDPALALVT